MLILEKSYRNVKSAFSLSFIFCFISSGNIGFSKMLTPKISSLLEIRNISISFLFRSTIWPSLSYNSMPTGRFLYILWRIRSLFCRAWCADAIWIPSWVSAIPYTLVLPFSSVSWKHALLRIHTWPLGVSNKYISSTVCCTCQKTEKLRIPDLLLEYACWNLRNWWARLLLFRVVGR